MEIFLFAIGVGILCYVGFIFLFPKAVPDDPNSHTQKSLDKLYQDTQQQASKSNDSLLARNDESGLTASFYKLPFMEGLYRAICEAGYQAQAGNIVFVFIGLLVVLFSILTQMFGLLGLVLSPVLAYYLPYKFFRGKVKKRNQQFLNLFPDVLDMIVRSVRSGFPLSTALKMVADNMDPPVSTEFKRVAEEISLGRSMTEALTRMGDRINEPDIHFFIVVLSVQQETGGNLAEVMENLSGVIRKRKQLRLKIKAMTSEGRATAWVLGALPVFVFLVLLLIQPDYVEVLWSTSGGQIIAAAAMGLIGLTFFIVRQMVDIEI